MIASLVVRAVKPTPVIAPGNADGRANGRMGPFLRERDGPNSLGA
jgi:hypothetical protein